MTIITCNDKLQQLCSSLANEPFIVIDTEFLRDKTYYPKLCLIQIAIKDKAVAIDCLVPNLEFWPLFAILNNPNIIKVFHSCRQDIEILYSLSGKIPQNIFDTQVAASVCGFGEAIGLEKLAIKLLDKKIDKSSRFTDWSRRPLTSKQIDYALNDVIVLIDIYYELTKFLDENKRAGWLVEEMNILTDPNTYHIIPENSWQRLNLKSKSPKFVYLASALATWREINAQKLDIPKSHLLKDDALLEIAASMPKNIEELKKIRQINGRITSSKLADEVIDIVFEAKNKDYKSISQVPQKEIVPSGATVDILRLLLKVKCEEHQVAERMVTNSRDLALLAYCKDSEELANNPIMHGWRYEIFGKYVEQVKNGKLAIKLENDKIIFFTP
jgi:ribonuclease D